jgi:hypothetical protein
MDWTGGTVGLNLQVPVGATVRIDVGDNKYLKVGSVTNYGTVQWSGNQHLYIEDAGRWVNEAS